MNVCTVITASHTARARVLARSLREHHPGSTLTALVADDTDDRLDPAGEPCEIVTPEAIGAPWRRTPHASTKPVRRSDSCRSDGIVQDAPTVGIYSDPRAGSDRQDIGLTPVEGERNEDRSDPIAIRDEARPRPAVHRTMSGRNLVQQDGAPMRVLRQVRPPVEQGREFARVPRDLERCAHGQILASIQDPSGIEAGGFWMADIRRAFVISSWYSDHNVRFFVSDCVTCSQHS